LTCSLLISRIIAIHFSTSARTRPSLALRGVVFGFGWVATASDTVGYSKLLSAMQIHFDGSRRRI
jgi:hypothetical protein